MSAALFSSLDLGPFALSNRVVVSPMCQYSADDGCASEWHHMHLMELAISGAGLVILEVAATERGGRITHGDLGLYSDANEVALGQIMASARRVAPAGTRWGVQIGHAGRKASSQRPWEGGWALKVDQDPWVTEAPSAIPIHETWPTPREMTREDMVRVRDGFAQAAVRAARIGLDVVELHAAHGYLLHQFLSPISNRRTDAFGGDFENRVRFPMEVAQAVREALPDHVVLGLRITGSDWLEGGVTIEEAVEFARRLKAVGAGYACVSSGGVAFAPINVAPGYQLGFAEAVKQGSGIATRAVGMIVTPHDADAVIQSGQADMVALGRAFLDNPRWVWHAAQQLGIPNAVKYPVQYERSGPGLWPGVEAARANRAPAPRSGAST